MYSLEALTLMQTQKELATTIATPRDFLGLALTLAAEEPTRL